MGYYLQTSRYHFSNLTDGQVLIATDVKGTGTGKVSWTQGG